MLDRYPRTPLRVAAAMAGTLALALSLAGSAAAQSAADEEDVPLDTKIFRTIMKDLGLRRDGEGIEYRERAPLVVPPSRELRPPQPEGSAAVANPAWPKDPDKASRPMSPAELNQNTQKKTFFDSVWSSFGPYKPETVPFSGEPPRTSMTAPPPGYQTPSPEQPYGLGIQDSRKATTVVDRVEPKN